MNAMKINKRIVLMLQFFTRIPINITIEATVTDFGKGLVFAPLIGLIIGAILAGLGYGMGIILPRPVAAALIIIFYIIITGGLHLDGLGDTFDGIFSNRSKERVLEIMRDSRVGTNAVLAVFSVLLIDYAVLLCISSKYLFWTILLMPVAGRIGSIVGAAVSVYARSGEGLGKSFIDCCGKAELAWGLLIYFIINILTLQHWIWIICIIPPITAFIFVKGLGRKIGGATGDVLGAVCELNQAIFLIAVCIVSNI
jgi:adenosylcobinamide-GDP ribazoletransferase